VPAPVAHTVGDPVDEQPAGESVTESPEGGLVVRGHLTPERAKAITQGLSTPVITVGLGLLAVAGVIAAIRGQQGLAALDGVLALYLGWILLSAPARAARRLLRVVGPEPVTWTYTAEGFDIVGARGSTRLPWSRVRDARIQGDMLVLRTRGARAMTGGLVGPLTPGQRERVVRWAQADAVAGPSARPPAG
jgi:hypothetical protein